MCDPGTNPSIPSLPQAKGTQAEADFSLTTEFLRAIGLIILMTGAWLGMTASAESATYSHKNGFSIEGEIVSVDPDGVIFRSPEGRLTPRIPMSELEAGEIENEPMVKAFLKQRKTTGDGESSRLPPIKSRSTGTANSGQSPPPSKPRIPEKPGPGEFFHDLAGIIPEVEAEKIRRLQEEAFRGTGAPIVVVTIKAMRLYDQGSPSIESFARRWFDTWGIGSQENNSGMLIIVSSGDRKARIELGADWGLRFDAFSKRLMDSKMVPEFKKDNYGKGILAAVSSLAEIAAAGPAAPPPAPTMTERILENPLIKFNRKHNPIGEKAGLWLLVLMTVVGIGFVIASFLFPQYRKPLLIFGLLLIALAVLFWIIIGILFLWGLATGQIEMGGESGTNSGRFGGGSGGFGGGFSGGGGASGSW